MKEVDLRTLQQWYEGSAKRAKWNDNIDHFIALLNTIRMERDIYASSVKFHERMDVLLEDYDIIANNAFRDGTAIFKCLLIGLKCSFGSTATTPDALQAQVDKLRKFWDEEKKKAEEAGKPS